MGDLLFKLEKAGFFVNGRELLAPLDMEISAGKVTALIGHNGSGKSTLLKILARQQNATSGEVTFLGKSLHDWNGRDFARQLAYLPQQPAVASGMLVHELVALGRYPWHGALGRFGDEDAKKVAAAMTATGVAAFKNRLVETLSGGERQRVWIAMLIAQDARCLLLDEPTSALDVGHQIEILSLVQTLSRRHNLSVFMVLHDINMAARFCDYIFALKAGKLIKQASAVDMMTSQTLQEIYGVPMEILENSHAQKKVAIPL